MIDWSRVMELRDEIGSDGFSEVVELFLEEVDEAIGKLRQGVDLSTLGPDLHFLKGSALSLGFASFSDLCAAGEREAEAGAAAEVDVAAIIAEFDASKTHFLSQLPQQLAA